MSAAIAFIGAVVLIGSIYAISNPHWPNGAALRLIWSGAKLTRCPHGAGVWLIVGDGQVRCLRCEKFLPFRIGKSTPA